MRSRKFGVMTKRMLITSPTLTPTSRKSLKQLVSGVGYATLTVLMCSCSKEPPPPQTPTNASLTESSLERILPLKDQTISQFQSISDGGEPSTFVLEIGRPRPELAELRISGRVQRLLVEPGRVDHATGGTLLQEPIEVGRTFRGSFGQVTITDINHTLTVPAGTFKNCVVTTEEGTTPPRRATSVYCPAVGLTSLVVEAFGGEGARLENVLTQHGPRYQL